MIHAIMQFAETEIRSILTELPPLPVDVSNWIVQTGVDSADEPAVWEWAVLPDDTTDLDTRMRIRVVVSTLSARTARHRPGFTSASSPKPKWTHRIEPAYRSPEAGPLPGNQGTEATCPGQPAPFHFRVLLRTFSPPGRRSDADAYFTPKQRCPSPMCLQGFFSFRHAGRLQTPGREKTSGQTCACVRGCSARSPPHRNRNSSS